MKTLTRQDVNKMIKHITWALKDASEESYRFAYIAMKIDEVKKNEDSPETICRNTEKTGGKIMLNKVIIIGNLGRDPEVRYTSGGTQVCNFSVATTKRRRDQGGQLQESTEWHRITAWGRHAEICGQYLRKGSKVYIEGKLQTRKWQDQSGQDRYTTEIVAKKMKMLDSKPQEQRGVAPQPETQHAPEQQAWVKPNPNRHNPPGYEDVPF